MYKFITGFFTLSISLSLFSQQLPVPRNIQDAFSKQTRSRDGRPGENYWQNKASYDLKINFDPSTRLLNGEETISYSNNSPDTLKQVVFKLYPNLYKKGVPRQSRISPEDEGEGMIIDSAWINNKLYSGRLNMDGTNMTIGRQLLVPKQVIQFKFIYHYTLNKGSHVRTGEIDPGADFVAYFFPRIAVYDDIDGWNLYPYNGTQEFYNDFCDFKAAITVPNS